MANGRVLWEMRRKLPRTSGIYKMVKDGVIIYVGKAVNLYERHRNGTHHRYDDFARLNEPGSKLWVEWEYVPERKLLDAERALVNELKPALNVIVRGPRNAPPEVVEVFRRIGPLRPGDTQQFHELLRAIREVTG